MKYCKNCGQPMDDNHTFCAYCGTNQNSEPIVEDVIIPTATADAMSSSANESNQFDNASDNATMQNNTENTNTCADFQDNLDEQPTSQDNPNYFQNNSQQSQNTNPGNPNYSQNNQSNSNYFGQDNTGYGQPNQNFNQGNPNYGQNNQNFNQGNPNYGQNNQNFSQGNPNYFNQGYNQNANYNQGYNPNNNYAPNGNYSPNYNGQVKSSKSKTCAGLLGIFLGCFGAHNFYLGKTGLALAQLLITLCTCFVGSFITAIWGLVEGIMCLTGNITDKDGLPLSD